jgi:hypothetical protein
MKKIIVSLLILIASVASLLLLNQAGISARKGTRTYSLARERFPAYLTKRTVDSYALWHEKGAQGRIVVHLGKYLHFMGSELPGTTQIPEIVKAHSHFSDRRISYRDFLWVALQSNIAREIVTVIPPEEFRKRFGLTDAAPIKDVTDHEYGSPRRFTTSLTSTSEPVLLNIDASYFASADAAKLLDLLQHSGLKADLVTLCLAEDNPDVTDPERQRLLEFARLLAQRAEVTPFTPSSPSQTVAK